MKKTFIRIKLIISILLFVGTCVTYYYFSNKISENTQIGIESRQIVLRHQDETAHVKTLENIISKSKDDRGELDTFFVPEEDLVSFIELLEKTSSSAGVKLDVKNVSNFPGTLESKGLGKLMVTFVLSGNWQKLNNYISVLEKMPFKLSISKLELVRISDAGNRTKTPEWMAGLQVEVDTLLKDYFTVKK